jgi:hypothetical protein
LEQEPLETGEQGLTGGGNRRLNPGPLHSTLREDLQHLAQCPPGADAASVASSWQLTEELLKPLLAQVGRAELALLQPSAEARHVPQLGGD